MPEERKCVRRGDCSQMEGLTDATMEALARLGGANFADTLPGETIKEWRTRKSNRRDRRADYRKAVGVCRICSLRNPRLDGDDWYCGVCFAMVRAALAGRHHRVSRTGCHGTWHTF
jgi:hypothetical protein